MFKFLKWLLTFEWLRKEATTAFSYKGTIYEGRLLLHIPNRPGDLVDEGSSIAWINFRPKSRQMIHAEIQRRINECEEIGREVALITYEGHILADAATSEDIDRAIDWLKENGHWRDPTLCN